MDSWQCRRRRLKERRREDMRDEIVAASIELIDDVGIGGFSVVALAERMGMSDGNIYNYFSSQSDLLEHVAMAVGLDILQRSAQAAEEAGDSAEALEASVRSHVEPFRDDWRPLWFVFGLDAPRPEQLPPEMLEALFKELARLFDALESKLISDGEDRLTAPEVRPRLRSNVAQVIADGLTYAYYCASHQDWSVGSQFDELLDELTGELVRGTCVAAGEDGGNE